MARITASKTHGAVLWPSHYQLVATLTTDDLSKAVNWTRKKHGWFLTGTQLLPPFDWTDEKLPPEGTNYDVFVTPDGTAYRVNGSTASVIAQVPLPRQVPRQPRRSRDKNRSVARNRSRKKTPRPYKYRSSYQIDKAKELIAFILMFLMTAVVFGLVRRYGG